MLDKGEGVIIWTEAKVQGNQWDCTAKHYGYSM